MPITTESFDEIYSRYYNQLVFFCFKVLGDIMEAEDATANVFYNFLKLNKQDVNSVRGYLFIAARNECRNFLRRKKHESKLFGVLISDDEFYNIKIKSVFVDAVFKHANEKLKPKAKEIFLLKYRDGLSSKEISIRVNRSISTVRNTLAQSLEKLRPLFNKHEYI